MAVIDPKKLLPESSKTTTILIPKKNVSVSPTSAPALKPADVGESVGGKLVVKKLIKIDEILQDTLKVKKDREKKEGQEKKEDKREKREEALEARKDKKKKADKMFTVPKGKGISWLGNWLTWTVAGFLFNNFMGLLDYLKPFVNIALELGKILYNVFTTIVSGVVSFIELGFNAYNTIEGLIEGLGGEGAKKVFNDMSGALTTAMNVAMIALMVAASTGSGKPGKPGKPGRSGPGGGRPRVTQSGGGNANRFGLRNPLRNRPGVTQGGAGTRVTQAVGNRLTGRGAARVTTSAGSKVAGKLGLKAAGRVLKPILSKVPFVGGLLEFFLSWALGDPIGKAAFRGVGMTLGSWIGGLLGTLIPIPFVGSAIGAFLGGMGAAELAGLMYDGIFGGKNAPKPKVEAKSQGGQVGVKKKPRRGISRRKKKVKVSKVNPVKTFPGKDFTSKQKIEEFYGKDEELDGLGLSSKINTPFDALMDSAKVAKKNNAVNGVIGSLIGTGIDLTLGQKPTSKTIQEISSTLATFVQASMQKEMNSTVDSVKELFSLQQGGSVPESRMISRRKEDPVAVMKQKITRGIASSITKTSSEIFGKIRTAMSGKKEADKARGAAAANNTYADAPFGSDILVTGGSADFWTLAAIASLEGINPQGQADVAQSIYNRQKAGIYPGGPSLKGLINATDQYSPVRESDPALWAAITDKQSAIAAVESHRNGRGRGKQLVEGSAAAITNRSLQDNAREFVGGRTDFSTPQVMNVDGAHAEYRGTHRASEKTRHNHIFGWFVGPGAVAYGTRVKGKGAAAAVPDLQTMRTAAPTSGIFDGGTGLGGVVKGDPVSQNNFGQFRQYYNNGRGGRHMGVDIAADVGAPLTAVRNGVYMDQDFNSGWGLFSVYKTDNGEYHLYAHQSKRAGKKKGDKIKAGEIIGYCGYSGRVSPPGPAGSHLHWEIGNSWNGYQIGGRYDPLSKYSYKLPFTVGRKTAPRSAPDPVSTSSGNGLVDYGGGSGQYDVVIPLDHTKKPGTIPDTPGGNTFKNSNATGADGRERQYQDKAANIIAKQLASQGLRVRIMAPEEFSSYRGYDKAVQNYASQGVRIVPIHFDAKGSTGFMTITRAGDSGDRGLAAPIDQVLRDFAAKNPDLGGFRTSTQGNATINRAAASPAALVELGVMVDWEAKYGKNFTQTPAFQKFAQDVADAIYKGGGFRRQASVGPPQSREVASLQRTPDYAEGQTTLLLQKQIVMSA